MGISRRIHCNRDGYLLDSLLAGQHASMRFDELLTGIGVPCTSNIRYLALLTCIMVYWYVLSILGSLERMGHCLPAGDYTLHCAISYLQNE